MSFKSPNQAHFYFASQKDKQTGQPINPALHQAGQAMPNMNAPHHSFGQNPQALMGNVVPQIPAIKPVTVSPSSNGQPANRFGRVKKMFKGPKV